MADFVTGAGATFGLSAAQPATYNEAGYEALTFTNVGKVTDLGNPPTIQWQEVVVSYLGSAGEDVAKGGFSLGSQTITVALDGDDAGQALLKTAVSSQTAVYSIKIDHPVLGTRYAQALIMGGPESYGDNNTAATWQITIRYKIASATVIGIVDVAAS